MQTITIYKRKISGEQVFMLSVLIVNAGNYIYNLLLGRILGPKDFADAALLITLLLVLSFLGMTFQLAMAKFAVTLESKQWQVFKNVMYKYAAYFGVAIGLGIIASSKLLQQIFNMETHWVFVIMGLGVPLYFFISVNRGELQGKQSFMNLSVTYQTEMWSRLLLTIPLLLISGLAPSLAVAIGMLCSLVFGLYPSNYKTSEILKHEKTTGLDAKRILNFILLTAGYELTQIVINNSDVLLVKHYFESEEAGMYAALSLIGRVVYFVAWMFVMLLLPKVVKKAKQGEETASILFKYMAYILVLAVIIVGICYLFPTIIIEMMFGSAYLSMANLLWQYAVATSLFALANVFAYYYISLDKYLPVIISAVFGFLQVGLVVLFHNSLQTVVNMQIYAMVALLVFQVAYFAMISHVSNKK